MHIILTGVTGLLGEAFVRLLADTEHRVTTVTREVMDLSKLSSVSEYLSATDFDLLINPAGMTGLEQCLDDPDTARLVNLEAPALMADICKQKGAQFVHFSTDYVFGGRADKLLTELDYAQPISVYGMTKLAGENAVLEKNSQALVCRVSWLFGPGRVSVLDQVLLKLKKSEPLEYIEDKWSVPTYVDDVVTATMKLIESKAKGVFHVCSDSDPVSWWEYAREVARLAFSLGLVASVPEIKKAKLASISAFRAARPIHTAMSCAKLRSSGVRMPAWTDSAKTYLESRAQLQ